MLAMLASAPVPDEVSEVSAGGADRPSAATGVGGRRRSVGRMLAVALIVAALAIAAVFAATSGLPKDRIIRHAAGFGVLAGDEPVDPGPPPRFKGVRFPDLAKEGWQPDGARRDVVADRVALTVFYTGAGEGRRLAVTILFGQALPPPPNSSVVSSGGIVMARMVEGDRSVVSWRRRGRTTIISAASTDPADLVRLARIATPVGPRK